MRKKDISESSLIGGENHILCELGLSFSVCFGRDPRWKERSDVLSMKTMRFRAEIEDAGISPLAKGFLQTFEHERGTASHCIVGRTITTSIQVSIASSASPLRPLRIEKSQPFSGLQRLPPASKAQSSKRRCKQALQKPTITRHPP